MAEHPKPEEAWGLPPEAYSTPVDGRVGTLWDEAKADRAMGNPTCGTRGAADIPPEDR